MDHKILQGVPCVLGEADLGAGVGLSMAEAGRVPLGRTPWFSLLSSGFMVCRLALISANRAAPPPPPIPVIIIKCQVRRVTRKQTLRSLSLSYPKGPSINYVTPERGTGGPAKRYYTIFLLFELITILTESVT